MFKSSCVSHVVSLWKPEYFYWNLFIPVVVKSLESTCLNEHFRLVFSKGNWQYIATANLVDKDRMGDDFIPY